MLYTSYCTNLKSMIIPDGVESIGKLAFTYCAGLADVYFTGTEEEWAAISIGEENDALSTATVHYNYIPEE